MKSTMFKAVLWHELKTLGRNKTMIVLFIIMSAMVIASLWSGNSMYQKQLDTIRHIGLHEKEMQDSLINRITRVEKAGMVYPGFIWDDPTFAYNTARNEGPRFAVKVPYSLQVLNVGQSDIQPFYYKVYINKKQYLTYETEITNSFLQFIGNFDFSFVVVFLFPLLIIVFTYNVYAQEKEQGTWVLLRTSNQSIAGITLLRILIRYVLFAGSFWLIIIPSLCLCIGRGYLVESNWWWLVAYVSVYFLFWFAVSLLVNSFALLSNINAMILIFTWLFTSILTPNLMQVILNAHYPIPSRISLTDQERKAVNKYFEKDGQDLTQEVFNNPRTQIRQASVVTPGMVYGYGVIVYKSQEIKDAAARLAEDKLYTQVEKQQQVIRKWGLISPALMLQETLSALSGTHWFQFNAFSRDVDQFRLKTQRFYYPKMARESTFRTFTVKDARAIPLFTPREYMSVKWYALRSTLALYGLFVVLITGIAYRRLLSDTGAKART